MSVRNMEYLLELYRDSKATDYEGFLQWVDNQDVHDGVDKFIFLSFKCYGVEVLKNAVKFCQEVEEGLHKKNEVSSGDQS